jgi:hypothetical protein
MQNFNRGGEVRKRPSLPNFIKINSEIQET